MTHCTRVFLDVGANIGVNMRFLYEPEKYPNTAFMVSTTDKVFGKDRNDVCYFRFEANTAHYKRLQFLKRNFHTKRAQIWNQPVAVHGYMSITTRNTIANSIYVYPQLITLRSILQTLTKITNTRNGDFLQRLGQILAYPCS
jgi:hypothetical protein